MKKLTALFLTLVLALGIPATAFAAKDADGNETTTLTVTIPAPSYTLHVPADTTLTYGDTDYQDIGTVKVTDVVGYKSISVAPKYTDLINTAASTDTIPLTLYDKTRLDSSDPEERYFTKDGERASSKGHPVLYNQSNPAEQQYSDRPLLAKVEDWSGATPGATYKARITYVLNATLE